MRWGAAPPMPSNGQGWWRSGDTGQVRVPPPEPLAPLSQPGSQRCTSMRKTMTSDTPPDGAQPPSSTEPPAAIRPIHRRPDRVVLQADVAADGSRNLSVEREGDDVVIRGHDLGPVVTRAFGPGAASTSGPGAFLPRRCPRCSRRSTASRAMTPSSSCTTGRSLTRVRIRAPFSSALTCRSSSRTG